ncbi:aspartate-alanine antiporter [Francisella tularensis subsp. novicida]|uniref:Aspartate-alanine antiporter n=2 Tax=Francisella tularensis TaxID=263 RepID=A0A6I4RXP6_FRATU|nr:aspartate-alanine antiporter [Francisella tularensis]ABK89250.1 aspartate:alanine exchanger (AAE) family protein [Francisella tularensis subsp. novicida U112]AJI60347.1 aspartate-alanine antiporter [Francisella tularensis subsp. novicida U112]EDX19114.1 aspartate:alanine antiporter [Francisella tularensis subsp. novicida FTE]MBK2035094.1 aspartate-alanine antiporter [Francisella tularensis subsp. novicida]MBK2116314.1 aspartate-alanine antiporter [Francisella tularensis subsp. novicida]
MFHEVILNVLRNPFIALFLTLSLGYLVGKIKYKTFVLGGISGSLIIGVIIGQLNITISPDIGSLFFALFIYAVGYQGGAQFFRSLNKDTLLLLASSTITCVLGLVCVLFFAWIFQLDKGTAAGLGAGGLTQSAMIGSANNAIAMINSVSESTIHTMQTNVAVGYAVCYIFGSFGPIILLATIFPLVMKWDLRKEAIKLATEQSDGNLDLEVGQFSAFSEYTTRAYKINRDSLLLGKSLVEVYKTYKYKVVIENIIRDNKLLTITPETTINTNDIVAITFYEDLDIQSIISKDIEVTKPEQFNFIEEKRSLILTNKNLFNKTIKEVKDIIQDKNYYGVFLQKIIRSGQKLPISDDLKLRRGDEIRLIGKPEDLDKISNKIGTFISEAPITDFIFFGLGMVLGYIFGLISFNIFGISITLGAGVGCLLSGLIFGWIRSIKPQFSNLPVGASNFIRDLGLAIFVASVGITAGPQAITAIKEHGLTLFFLGIGVTIIPQIISFYISYYLLKIKNPIVLLATIAGGRSANPGFAALLERAGNATPVIPFTSSYALANIWLTLWGPVIVALVTIIPK